MDEIRELMIDLIKTSKGKGYSRQAIEIIGAIACSERAVELGYTTNEGLSIAINLVKEHDNERDCINALIELINFQ